MTEYTKVGSKIIGIFQPFKTPDGVARYHLHNVTLPKLKDLLMEYYKAFTPRDSAKIKVIPLRYSSTEHNTLYYTALATIARAVGAHIYCRKEIHPNYNCNILHVLYIIGPPADVNIIVNLGNYLHHLEREIANKTLKGNKDTEPAELRKMLRMQFFNPIIRELQDTYNIRERLTSTKALYLKNRVLLEFILNNYKFEYDMRENNKVKPKTLKRYTLRKPRFKDLWLLA